VAGARARGHDLPVAFVHLSPLQLIGIVTIDNLGGVPVYLRPTLQGIGQRETHRFVALLLAAANLDLAYGPELALVRPLQEVDVLRAGSISALLVVAVQGDERLLRGLDPASGRALKPFVLNNLETIKKSLDDGGQEFRPHYVVAIEVDDHVVLCAASGGREHEGGTATNNDAAPQEAFEGNRHRVRRILGHRHVEESSSGGLHNHELPPDHEVVVT
jgi:hypothetical protein